MYWRKTVQLFAPFPGSREWCVHHATDLSTSPLRRRPDRHNPRAARPTTTLWRFPLWSLPSRVRWPAALLRQLFHTAAPPPWRCRAPICSLAAAGGQPFGSPCCGAPRPPFPRGRQPPVFLPSLLQFPTTTFSWRGCPSLTQLLFAAVAPRHPPSLAAPTCGSSPGGRRRRSALLPLLYYLARGRRPPAMLLCCCGDPSPPLPSGADSRSRPWRRPSAGSLCCSAPPPLIPGGRR